MSVGEGPREVGTASVEESSPEGEHAMCPICYQTMVPRAWQHL